MSAGHDFNELLLGALYGELSAVEESRLQAHLAAHPADQQLLRELTRTREAIRSSEVLSVIEPPQAISALLLQEAARKAPRARRALTKSSSSSSAWRWLAALVRHPALAAAAMAVLVAGVFGTMALHDKNEVAESTAAGTQPAERAQPAAPAAEPAAVAAPSATAAPAGEASAPAPALEGAVRSNADKVLREDSFGVGLAKETEEGQLRQRAAAPAKKGKASRGSGYLDATEQDDVPLKDFDDAEVAPRDEAKAESRFSSPPPPPAPAKALPQATTDERRGEVVGGAAAASASAESTSKADDADAPRRELDKVEGKRSAGAAPSTTRPPAAPVAPVTTATVARSQVYDDAWAKSEHVRLVRLARASKCGEAASVASTLAARAPRYYQDHVANDGELRVCAAAIRDQLNLQAEQAKRKAPATDAKK